MGALVAAWLALSVAADPGGVDAMAPFSWTVQPRLLHQELELYGIRPAEVQRGLERLATRQEWATLNRGDLVLAPHLMNRMLGLGANEYLQLRLTRATARLELRLTWN